MAILIEIFLQFIQTLPAAISQEINGVVRNNQEKICSLILPYLRDFSVWVQISTTRG